MNETVFAAQGLGNPIASVDQSSGLYYPNAQRFEATQPSSRRRGHHPLQDRHIPENEIFPVKYMQGNGLRGFLTPAAAR
jgi:hypothetical protein